MAAKAHMSVRGAVNCAKMPPRNIPPHELKALKELASDEDILVLPTDKGRATIVMDRTDYDKKIYKMLSEESTYQLRRFPHHHREEDECPVDEPETVWPTL